MPPADRAQVRRQKAAAAAGLDGWFLVRLADGFADNGEIDCWHEYEHLDGRQATVFSDGACTDPGLQTLLSLHQVKAPGPGPRTWRALLARALCILGWKGSSGP